LYKKILGRAVTTISPTRLAYFSILVNEIVAGSFIFNIDFIRSCEPGITVSKMLTNAQTTYMNYIQHFWKDGLTIEEYILLGDPSLRIGGYSNKLIEEEIK
jgi:hypothetical protein